MEKKKLRYTSHRTSRELLKQLSGGKGGVKIVKMFGNPLRDCRVFFFLRRNDAKVKITKTFKAECNGKLESFSYDFPNKTGPP